MKIQTTILTILFVAKLLAQSPLDSTFGNNGKVVTPLVNDDAIIALSEQSDSKVIALGRHHLVRYTYEGTLDTAFASNGIVDSLGFTAVSLLVDKNDHILIGGNNATNIQSIQCNGSAVIARFLPDGVIDTSFGQNGLIITDTTLHNRMFSALEVQSDGKILAAVQVSDCSPQSSGQYSLLRRLNPDGTVDTTFSGQAFSTPFAQFISNIKALHNNKIVAVGFSEPSISVGSNNSYTALFNGNTGNLDSSYGLNGIATNNQYSLPYLNTILPNGQVFFQGTAIFSGGTQESYSSIDENGLFDSTFNTQYTYYGFVEHYGWAMAAYSDKRFISAGYSQSTFAADFSLIMLNEYGQRDSTCFPPIKIAFGGSDIAYAVLIDSNGDILVAGESSADFAIARLKQSCFSQNDFVTTWKTNNPGSTNQNSIHIPIDSNFSYNYSVDWDNDGIFDTTSVSTSLIHSFIDSGYYTIRIQGQFPSIKFEGSSKLISVDQWGNQDWKSINKAFKGCYNLLSVGNDAPKLDSVSSLAEMFSHALNFDSEINHWNVSSITDMSLMFDSALLFNRDLSSWDVSSVANMGGMFNNAKSFNQNLGMWNISSVQATAVPLVNGMWTMLDSTNLSTANYDSTLIGWNNQPHNPNIGLGSVGLKYCDSKYARDSLMADGWIFYGDTLEINCCLPNGTNFSETACRYYVSPSGKYTWSQSGTYVDTLINTGGCDSILTINLTINNADSSVSVSGITLMANATNATYQWLDCNTMQPIGNETNQSFTPTQNGDYAVIVTENGCTDTSACFAITTIGLDEWANAGINVYPNPSKGFITLAFKTTFTGSLEILTLSGQQFYQQSVNREPQLELNLELAKGIYILRLSSQDQSLTKRLIIQ